MAIHLATREEGELDRPVVESSAEARSRESQSAVDPMDDDAEIRRIQAVPKEVGVLLIVAGIGGILLPGPVGAPFLVLGGVMLWPRAYARMEIFVQKRFPRMHHQSVRQIKRFLDDLDRRYPIPKS
jgi:hypothetical protein